LIPANEKKKPALDDVASGHGVMVCDKEKNLMCCRREDHDCCEMGTEIFQAPPNIQIREITDPPRVAKPRDPARVAAERRKVSTIIGIAVGLGIILVLVLLAWLGWCLRRRSRKRKKSVPKPNAGASELDGVQTASKRAEITQVEAVELDAGDSKVIRGELDGSTMSPGTMSRSATLSPDGDGLGRVNVVTADVIELDGDIAMTPLPVSPDIKHGDSPPSAVHTVSPLLPNTAEESESDRSMRSAVSRPATAPTRRPAVKTDASSSDKVNNDFSGIVEHNNSKTEHDKRG
jgi:hypothetical protein